MILDDIRKGIDEHLERRLQWLHAAARCAECGSEGEPGSVSTGRDRNIADLALLLTKQSRAAAFGLSARLQSDRPALEREFAPDLGLVTGIRAGLSDPHFGGQTVVRLHFQAGLTLYYKPRPVGLLAAWNHAARHVVEPLLGKMPTPRVMDCGAYGWAEAVQRSSGYDSPARHARAGAMLCLAYVLGAVDLHTENFVDHPAAPVLVDAETVLWAGVERAPSVDSERSAAFDLLFRDSVVRTGMLPRWQRTIRGAYLSPGIMSGRAAPFEPGAAYEADLLRGFTAVYETLSKPAAAEVLLAAFEKVAPGSVRVLIRPTYVYQRLLDAGIRVYAARGPGARSAMLQRALGRGAIKLGAAGQAILDLELEALERADIPRFSRTQLERAGLRFEPVIGMDYVESRLEGLSREDLARQVKLIEASLALVSAK